MDKDKDRFAHKSATGRFVYERMDRTRAGAGLRMNTMQEEEHAASFATGDMVRSRKGGYTGTVVSTRRAWVGVIEIRVDRHPENPQHTGAVLELDAKQWVRA